MHNTCKKNQDEREEMRSSKFFYRQNQNENENTTFSSSPFLSPRKPVTIKRNKNIRDSIERYTSMQVGMYRYVRGVSSTYGIWYLSYFSPIIYCLLFSTFSSFISVRGPRGGSIRNRNELHAGRIRNKTEHATLL